MPASPEEHDSRSVGIAQLLRILRDRKWVVIGLTILGVGAAMAHSVLANPQYRATATILRQTTSLDQALFGTQIFRVSDESRDLITAADLIKLDQVAQKVKEELASTRSPQSLKSMITTKPDSTANTVDIIAESSDPKVAANVANSFARQFILYRQGADRAILSNARTEVESQLESMTDAELASTRGQTLSQKVEELSVLESMQTGGYELVETAIPPTSAYNKHARLDAIIGLVLGLILGLVVAGLVHLADKRIKDEDQFEEEFGVPIVARVPVVGRRWRGTKGDRSPVPVGFSGPGARTVEAFRTLRSNLKYFEVGRDLRTVLVTSALPRESKSVTAINLSISLAMSGARVVVLDADLRRPMLGLYLELDRRRGLTDLLAGTSGVADVVQVVEVDRFMPGSNGSGDIEHDSGMPSSAQDLLCIAAGPLPPNPAELLAMPRTGEVLKELRTICDYVVIDAAPVMLVSDSLELAKEVDGVILVARQGLTRVEDARRTRQSLERVGVKPLGLVVSGVRNSKSYYRQYGHYYDKR